MGFILVKEDVGSVKYGAKERSRFPRPICKRYKKQKNKKENRTDAEKRENTQVKLDDNFGTTIATNVILVHEPLHYPKEETRSCPPSATHTQQEI